ncbi:MAG: endonuclease/exonuclease/phosphatase family protein [Methylomonas sp.]|jgi:exonuclease III|uniref:endonuclease/exonuclease/phosphatase family protein n=1 Tax=Methylomonas sp. TaxID=418 RepID=UPI0025F9A164|nr:endonuclease/exonuclease/phosphatase family protein [Methylomonas sp.]MCK9606283.1 endonuclease/exonuclease/phosphatase family protein [Methylomonas sp.]
MLVSVGTFNLNNLFSRFNFQAAISNIPQSSGGFSLEFDDERNVQVRTFMGHMVKGKEIAETQAIAKRIQAMNVDVLAVQEVEHIEILKSFNHDFLNGLYPHVALIEGNDSRMIDIGVLSKLPFGAITSFQAAVHPAEPERRVFSRDLLRIEILNANRSKKLFTFYNTHLKSHYVPFGQNQESGEIQANHRRRLQAETISRLIAETERPNSSFILTGDMNDPPDSEFLQSLPRVEGQDLFNALHNPTETRPAKAEKEGPGPQTPAWTYRRNPAGPEPPTYQLIDQIWLSRALIGRFVAAHIDRRTKHGGDGSDHDPAWIELNF